MGFFNWIFKSKNWKSLGLILSAYELELACLDVYNSAESKTDDKNYKLLKYRDIIDLCQKAIYPAKTHLAEVWDCDDIARQALCDVRKYWAFNAMCDVALACGNAIIETEHGGVHSLPFFVTNEKQIVFYNPKSETFFIDTKIKVYELRF